MGTHQARRDLVHERHRSCTDRLQDRQEVRQRDQACRTTSAVRDRRVPALPGTGEGAVRGLVPGPGRSHADDAHARPGAALQTRLRTTHHQDGDVPGVQARAQQVQVPLVRVRSVERRAVQGGGEVNRFDTALALYSAPFVPSLFELSSMLFAACVEVLGDGLTPETDPAVQVIAYFVAFRVNADHVMLSDYHKLVEHCQVRAKENEERTMQ